ncbi:PREDICTED: alpha-1,3-mannosyl-glycoprotein 4-beta-N-acetylglucosaminyltransferase C-like [Branchiostoma belcheri]|uniref:Alpha-1,3-mannosyl-glycoprotein 4-beta-N-acetylglucosaminyltransferase C-like n=1 Tax=Branchiostoma belcheri TaxID=7741 RepID=A0A6P4Y3H1_BRABE|nr:PREDICTED: alpha-1,3-mannosyl-glycoprotein 4-beta-N-acetylglucosaminyltransferase C-like [Branchiostoma belcheri]
MALRSGMRLWLSRNVVLGSLAVSLALNAWILSSTLLTQQVDPTCEVQKETLIQSMKILNNRLLRQEVPDKLVVPPTKERSSRGSSEGCSRPAVVDIEAARVWGKPRMTKGFLSIGIPTVKRENNTNYLDVTLNSLIEHTPESDRGQVTIVIFLADLDRDYNRRLSLEIQQNYSRYLSNGFIQVVQAHKSFYPQLEGLKQNFNDTQERVKWRSKQCVDFAFLFSYCRDLSEFYLQLEDDVISAEKYLKAIRDFVNSQTSAWTMLEFSELGFIGKLFKSSDLQRLADFIMLFYQEMPVDYLIRYFIQLLPHQKSFLHLPSLFQHIGKHSSLSGKQQNLVDSFFVDSLKRRYNDSDNPSAAVSTNIPVFRQFKPQLAYSAEPGYLWAKSPLAGQAFFVLFEDPARLARIVVETGSVEHSTDVLENGTLEASPRLVSVNELDNTPYCAEYVKLGEFENGRVEVMTRSREGLGSFEVKCLKVTVNRDQQVWMLVKEIAVWTVK